MKGEVKLEAWTPGRVKEISNLNLLIQDQEPGRVGMRNVTIHKMDSEHRSACDSHKCSIKRSNEDSPTA